MTSLGRFAASAWSAWGLTLLAVSIIISTAMLSPRAVAPPALREIQAPARAGFSESAMVARSRGRSFSLNLQRPPAASGYSLNFHEVIQVPWFDAPAPAPRMPQFNRVRIGDVTGDGRPDLIVTGSGLSSATMNELLVYAQMPDGTLGPPARYPMSSFDNSVSLGDFNEDGVKDVVVGSASEFSTYVSRAGGGFTIGRYPGYDGTDLYSGTPVVPMDVNRDGHLDLVYYLTRSYGAPYVMENMSRIVVWLGNGSGGFSAHYSFVTYGNTPWDSEVAISLVAGDLNRDGYQDLAVRVRQFNFAAQSYRNVVRVYLNETGGLMPAYELDAWMDTNTWLSGLDYLAIGDFNGDGLNDLAGASGNMDQRIWILPQSASLRFESVPIIRSSQPIGTEVSVADLDRNGADDLLVSHQGWDRITYHLQSGGVIGAPVMRQFSANAASGGFNSTAIGDINSDGCPDVVVSGVYWGLTIFHGRNCSRPTRGQADIFVPR